MEPEAFLFRWLHDVDLSGRGLSPRSQLSTYSEVTSAVFFDSGKVGSASRSYLSYKVTFALRGLVAASQINPGVLRPFPFRAFCVSILSSLNLAGLLTVLHAVFQECIRSGGYSPVCPFHVTMLAWTRVSCVLTVCF